jgi:hypothetical protein
MSDINCESILIAEMALRDREASPLSLEVIELHLRNCDRCRAEVASLRAMDELLGSQNRLRPVANIWPMVSERLEVTSTKEPSFKWQVLLLFGIPLFGYKFLLLVLQTGPSLWSKLIPVILVIAIFSYLKTNPFKINCELTLRGDASSS